MSYVDTLLKHLGDRHPQKSHAGGRGGTKAAKDWYLGNETPKYSHPFTSLGGYTSTQSQETFDKVATNLSAETGIGKETLRDYFIDWGKADRQGDKYKALQGAADKVFDGGKSAQPEAEKLLRAAYKNTQQELAKAGVKAVTLFRGTSAEKGTLKSWTLDKKLAGNYAKRNKSKVVEKVFSVKDIVSTAFTGFGNLGDFEVVTK